ncbi:DNA repair protein RadC [Chryseobacterium oleae]|uniref:DNA repair protein RadC n=1 Tax=Chryseobacterium oleae TaxID=491207 RepID=A0A1I4YZH6_CHROL|nr:JAB domain-containing protein [Chryseobacterium oleae]SFN43456.1 DNA repair protein RadC [Chryseobacterium oleae]
MRFNVVNEIKLSYSREGNCERLITDSRDAGDVFREHFDSDEIDYRESFYTLYLSQANKVLGIKKISESGISSTIVDVRIIMQAALLCNASCIIIIIIIIIIIMHNHPSGHLKASAEDVKMTQQIKEASKFLNIQLLDHCILTSTEYMSFADEGIL